MKEDKEITDAVETVISHVLRKFVEFLQWGEWQSFLIGFWLVCHDVFCWFLAVCFCCW